MSSATETLAATLSADVVDAAAVRRLCWLGVSDSRLRPPAWGIALGSLAALASSRERLRQRSREDYCRILARCYAHVDWNSCLGSFASSTIASASVSVDDLAIMRQIRKDVPRTGSGCAFFQHANVQLAIERVLYIWAIRHPACGYVQGMNDLVVPFVMVVATDRFGGKEVCNWNADECAAACDALAASEWTDLEADVYHLASRFMEKIQNNFTASQQGTHDMVATLESIIKLSDPELWRYISGSGVEFGLFAFRWMNCMLLRELPIALGPRLLDAYIADEVPLREMHVFTCAAMLHRFRNDILSLPKQDLSTVLPFLQNLPTHHFSSRDVAELLSKAYVLFQSYFAQCCT